MAKPKVPAILTKAAEPRAEAGIRKVKIPLSVANYRFPAARTATIQRGVGAGMLGINPITQGDLSAQAGAAPKFKRLYGQSS